MAVILGQFPITYRIVGVPRSKAADAVIEVTAARAFAHMTRRWPVDTAKSRGGLYYRLERTSKGVMMVVGNVNNYAFWVELIHYPLRKVLTAALFKRLAAGARADPDLKKVPRKLGGQKESQEAGPNSAPVLTAKPGSPLYSRPVTVRRIKPGTAKRTPVVKLSDVALVRRVEKAVKPPTAKQVAATLVSGNTDRLPPALLMNLTEEAIRQYAKAHRLSQKRLVALLALLGPR